MALTHVRLEDDRERTLNDQVPQRALACADVFGPMLGQAEDDVRDRTAGCEPPRAGERLDVARAVGLERFREHRLATPVQEAREFVEALRKVSNSTVAYSEIPHAQHAFDFFGSPRGHYTAEAIERFLSYVQARKHVTAEAIAPSPSRQP